MQGARWSPNFSSFLPMPSQEHWSKHQRGDQSSLMSARRTWIMEVTDAQASSSGSSTTPAMRHNIGNMSTPTSWWVWGSRTGRASPRNFAQQARRISLTVFWDVFAIVADKRQLAWLRWSRRGSIRWATARLEYELDQRHAERGDHCRVGAGKLQCFFNTLLPVTSDKVIGEFAQQRRHGCQGKNQVFSQRD